MRLKNFNKNSQIGSTLTWFVALILIVFIMVLFVAGVTGIAKLKGLPENQQNSPKSLAFSYAEEQELDGKLISFLNTPVKGFGTIYDVLSKADEKEGYADLRKTFFMDEAKKFLEKNFPASGYTSIISLNQQASQSTTLGMNEGRYMQGAIVPTVSSGVWTEIKEYGITNGVQPEGNVPFNRYSIKEIYILPNKKITLNVAKINP